MGVAAGGTVTVFDEMRALVVGAGSVGLRHHRVLEGLGFRSELVSRRPSAGGLGGPRVHSELEEAVRIVEPDHVVIATETSAHLSVLRSLAETGFAGTVLVEKPLAGSTSELWFGDGPFRAAAVGYHLRFHPVVAAARAALGGARIVTMGASVGQHLAAWRPGRPIGDTASARLEAGGGVLRDLSHELDLVRWFGGRWSRVCALGGRSGVLGPQVLTDDRWGILIELESGAVATIQMDALDHVGRRNFSLVAADRSVIGDLVAGTITHAGPDGGSNDRSSVDRDEVFADMHLALIAGVFDDRLCTLAEGMELVELIEAVERSVATGGWVVRDPSR